MSSIKKPLAIRSSKNSTPIQVKIKTEPNIQENLSKKRKDIDSAPEKVRNEVDEPKSCPQCHRNLLVAGTERNPCPVCCNRDNATLKGSNGPADLQVQFANVVAGEGTNTTHGSTNYQLEALETAGMWRGNAVGQPVKQLLQAVEQCYPSTFQELEIIPKAYRSSSLIQLHDLIKRFLETSVNALEEEDQLISLEAELSFFERFGFDLSWANKRVNMVRLLKFGNDPLRLRLVEANARFDQARLEYERATDVRNRMLHEVAQRVGAEFEGVLNGDLGFGMLPAVKRDPIDSQQHEENENEEDFRTYQRKEKRQRVTSAIKQKTKTVSAHNFKTITKLKLRNPPKPFYNAIKSLSSPQKKKVMDIGFGALLGSNCSGIPSAIGYFVVDSFDPKSMELTLPNGSIQISVELIHHIYRIPHGGTPVNSLVVNDAAKECYRVWKSQFVKDIRASDIAIKIQESDEADMIFVQNFIMLFLNSMVECMPSGSCMTDLLECIDESVDIKSIDWCGYVFESLKRCKRLWKRNDPRCYFTGPIVFLILLYFEATSFEKLHCPSNVQATSFWSVEKMKKREMLEIEDGIGRCEIKKLTEKVAVQEESELEVTKLLGDIESKLDSLLDVKIALELLFSSGIEKFPECTSLKEKKKLFHDMLISTGSKADPTIVDLSSENSEDDDNVAVQNNFPIDTDDILDGESESCPQCHQNLLVGGTKRYPCPVCCNLDKETSRSNGPADDIQDQVTLVTNVDDGRISDSNNLQDTNSVLPLPTLSPSVVYQPASLEDQGTSVGLWRGNAVGQPAKEILQAVEDDYPETFQGLQILPSPYWLSTLKGLHDFIKGFLETSVHALEEDKLTSLETDLNSFESIGFNLSWVRNRLDLAKKLKFGNDVLRLELVVLEESLKCVHEALVEASARFEKARLDYDRVTYARNKKLHEVAQKFGAEYDGVLNCNLGFGMLPGY